MPTISLEQFGLGRDQALLFAVVVALFGLGGLLLFGTGTPTEPGAGYNSPTTTATVPLAPEDARLQATQQALALASQATAEQIKTAGGAKITAVSFDESVLSARVANTNQVYMTTSNTNVPYLLRVEKKTYRGLSADEQAAVAKVSRSLTNPAPFPAKWTTDLKARKTAVDQYLALVNPAAFLDLLASKVVAVAPQDESGDKSTILALVPASEWSSIPGLESTQDKDIVDMQPALMQVQLDKDGALVRLLLVLPDKRQLMISVDKYAKQEVLPPEPNNVRASVPKV